MVQEPDPPLLPPRVALREYLWRLRESWGLDHVRRATPAAGGARAGSAVAGSLGAESAVAGSAGLANQFRPGAHASSGPNRDAGTSSPLELASALPPDAPAAERERALQLLAREIQGCRACRLCEKRKQAVPGEGPATARVAFIGEGPGYDEDRSGRPFVGAAGQLLTAIIERGMGIPRSEVWVGNTVKCRPPGNRDPEPDEIQACEPYLRRQLDIVRPTVIVTLGRFASQLLTGQGDGILKLRGKVYRVPPTWEVAGTPVVPTVHPSFLLRSPEYKPQCWEDIKLAMRELGLEPRGGGRSTGPERPS